MCPPWYWIKSLITLTPLGLEIVLNPLNAVVEVKQPMNLPDFFPEIKLKDFMEVHQSKIAAEKKLKKVEMHPKWNLIFNHSLLDVDKMDANNSFARYIDNRFLLGIREKRVQTWSLCEVNVLGMAAWVHWIGVGLGKLPWKHSAAKIWKSISADRKDCPLQTDCNEFEHAKLRNVDYFFNVKEIKTTALWVRVALSSLFTTLWWPKWSWTKRWRWRNLRLIFLRFGSTWLFVAPLAVIGRTEFI